MAFASVAFVNAGDAAADIVLAEVVAAVAGLLVQRFLCQSHKSFLIKIANRAKNNKMNKISTHKNKMKFKAGLADDWSPSASA